jgi:signal recognition particle subunit SRP54
MVSTDVRRPAAMEQLRVLGQQIGIPVAESREDQDPVEIVSRALVKADIGGHDVLLIDTAGRLQIDEDLMEELARLKATAQPHYTILVADAMTGQDAVNVAQGFHERLQISGLILTKLDSDARGGAALSVRAVTGAPILFAGTGEKLDALEVFHPDRLASRILGMGDVLSLIEKAQQNYDQAKAKELERKLKKNEFTIEDFAEQLRTIRRMGSLGDLLGMIPGLKKIAGAADSDQAKREMVRIQAIIDSMTREERHNHLVLNARRRQRIAGGSGTSVQDVNRFVKQFEQTRKMMKKITRMGAGRTMMRGLGLGS